MNVSDTNIFESNSIPYIKRIQVRNSMGLIYNTLVMDLDLTDGSHTVEFDVETQTNDDIILRTKISAEDCRDASVESDIIWKKIRDKPVDTKLIENEHSESEFELRFSINLGSL